MSMYDWAVKWGIPQEAMLELRASLGVINTVGAADGTEAGATKRIRLEGADKGVILWRNNVGVARDETDRVIRYGLANDSSAMNKNIKSSDLIGLRPNGQFVAREVKAPGWHYTGSAREQAQLKFLTLVSSLGGDACFATGEGTL